MIIYREFSRMWKFVRGKSQQTAEQQKLQKELFLFRKVIFIFYSIVY